MRSLPSFAVLLLTLCASSLNAAELLVEAESFSEHGGWKLDTQFIDGMGSPYLLAHGLGRPVANATTTLEFPETGAYRVFVRTKDWVAPWGAPGQPGRFRLRIDGAPLAETFGTKGAEWHWHAGGRVEIESRNVRVELEDLTGFDGRCDAIFFSNEDSRPPDGSSVLPAWRRKLLGLSVEPTETANYDLVVVGGGYSGMGAAISAARSGLKVALIQNRPVLGGNGSSEVRVWSMGHIRRGRFPRVGEIVEEFCDSATKSPGTYEEFEDEKKERIVRAEKNIDLFLDTHAYRVESDKKRISAVWTFDTRTSERRRFSARLVADCTGHGTIGFLAGADYDMTPKGRMGMSNMWAWAEGQEPREFPDTPWALDLEMEDFPYPRDHHGQWFWEGGFDKDPIAEAELIRDWNLRAVFGAFNAMKNRGGAEKHRTAHLTWLAFIGGPRESRRLLGDVVLTQEDIVTKREFPDGCVPSTWTIDLHYPKEQYAKKYPDEPFISIAVHDRRIDRAYGYPVPYRCFYSRDIENLFMAGRCISVTHEALGTTRVMKTCGMMGEVVGRAASICVARDTTPRGVYVEHLTELETLLSLPGKAWRATVRDEFTIPDDALELAGPLGPYSGLDPRRIGGLVIDDDSAEKIGSWTVGTGLSGYVGWNYVYAFEKASIRFPFSAPQRGSFEIRIAYRQHENRGASVPIVVRHGNAKKELRVDMRKAPPLEHGLYSLGRFDLDKGESCSVELSTDGAGGCVHADAVQVLRVDE